MTVIEASASYIINVAQVDQKSEFEKYFVGL